MVSARDRSRASTPENEPPPPRGHHITRWCSGIGHQLAAPPNAYQTVPQSVPALYLEALKTASAPTGIRRKQQCDNHLLTRSAKHAAC